MKYRNGELSVSLSNQRGRYKCIFETKNYMWVNYTNCSEVYDFYNDNLDRLYEVGITKTKRDSRELTSHANRMAYNIAKDGKRIKFS